MVADIEGTLVDDADASGGATVGDTFRFCTTVTGSGTCGAGRAITVTIPIPPLLELVPGSITTTHGAVDTTAEGEVVVTGIVLDDGEQATICFDALATAEGEGEVEATGEGPDASDSDTDAFVIGAPATGGALPADIPTASEWGLIAMTLLLALAGLLFIRRGGLLAIVIALGLAFSSIPDAGATTAKPTAPKKASAAKEAPRPSRLIAGSIEALQIEGEKVTIRMSDGSSWNVAKNNVKIDDRRVSGSDRRAQRKADKAARTPSAAGAEPKGKKRNRDAGLTVDTLAAMLSAPSATSARGEAGVPAILKVKRDGEAESARVQVTVYASAEAVREAMLDRERARARAARAARNADRKKSQ